MQKHKKVKLTARKLLEWLQKTPVENLDFEVAVRKFSEQDDKIYFADEDIEYILTDPKEKKLALLTPKMGDFLIENYKN